MPPLAVDDVDDAATVQLFEGRWQDHEGILGGKSQKKKPRKRRRPSASRGVPEAVPPEEIEEVDPFTAEIVLKDVACLQLGVHGAGKGELLMNRRCRFCLGPLCQICQQNVFTVTNIFDAEVDRWALGRVRTVSGRVYPSLSDFHPTGRLQPLEVVSVTCEFTGHSPGLTILISM